MEYEHYFCNKAGEWITLEEYPEDLDEVTFADSKDFKCAFQLY